MRVGITGHRQIENPKNWGWVEQQINQALAEVPPPRVGLTSLAIGADQLFAQLILRTNGRLEVVVPFQDYERTFEDVAARNRYRQLLNAAAQVTIMERTGSDEEAYFLAGKTVVNLASVIIAVWNGKPAAGLGGTADVVQYAIQRGKRLLHLNPVTLMTTTYPPRA